MVKKVYHTIIITSQEINIGLNFKQTIGSLVQRRKGPSNLHTANMFHNVFNKKGKKKGGEEEK